MTCFRLNNGETLHKYCINNKIPYCPIFRRLENGMSVNDAIDDYLKSKSARRRFVYKGKYVSSIFHSKQKEYSLFMYYFKIKKMSIDEAVEIVLRKAKKNENNK